MDRLIKLLNTGAKHPFTENDIVVSEPQVAHGHGWQNTVVMLHGAMSAGTYFRRQFYYRRFILNHHPTFVGEHQGEQRFSDFLPALNLHLAQTSVLGVGVQSKIYPMTLRGNDIVDLAFTPAPPGMVRRFTIQASPTSYVFTGSVTLEIKTPLPPPVPSP